MKPDPVFYDNSYDIVNFEEEEILQWIIPSFDFNKDSLKNFKLKLKWKTVWLALRGGYFVERTKLSARLEEWIVNEVINYLLEQEAKIILLPHSFHETDDVANDFLFLTKFIWQDWVLIKASLQEVYDTYRNKEIDFCFAERLHSIILCQVYGIPFVGVSYSKKTEEILRKLKV
jgi:polysaccharide pyruvyl transferase WcaK-like protein